MTCPTCHREFEPDLPSAPHSSVHHYGCPGCGEMLRVKCLLFRSDDRELVHREFVLIGPASRGRSR